MVGSPLYSMQHQDQNQSVLRILKTTELIIVTAQGMDEQGALNAQTASGFLKAVPWRRALEVLETCILWSQPNNDAPWWQRLRSYPAATLLWAINKHPVGKESIDGCKPYCNTDMPFSRVLQEASNFGQYIPNGTTDLLDTHQEAINNCIKMYVPLLRAYGPSAVHGLREFQENLKNRLQIQQEVDRDLRVIAQRLQDEEDDDDMYEDALNYFLTSQTRALGFTDGNGMSEWCG